MGSIFGRPYRFNGTKTRLGISLPIFRVYKNVTATDLSLAKHLTSCLDITKNIGFKYFQKMLWKIETCRTEITWLICRANQIIGFIWGKETLLNFIWVITKWHGKTLNPVFLQWRLSVPVWDWIWQISDKIIMVRPIYGQCCHHIKTNQLICTSNQLIGFHIIGMLALNRLTYFGLQNRVIWNFLWRRHINWNYLIVNTIIK